MLSASSAVVMATAVVLAFTVMGGNKAAGGEVFLEATAAAGPDPFTPSTATESQDAEVTPATLGKSKGGTSDARTLEVQGAYPGLYGGTRNVASCDVEKQIKFLTQHTDKGKAFADPLKIGQPDIAAYLRSLTPVRLVWDTRVTNHGYKDAAATSYQAVLQAGTPVLVDDRGVPRVRCACGNPLAPPVAVKGKQTYSGKEWSSFQSSDLVAVKPAEKPVKTVTMFDHDRKGWYERPSGDVQGKHDHEVPPPKGQKPDSPYPVLPPPHDGSVEKPPVKEPEKGTVEKPREGTVDKPVKPVKPDENTGDKPNENTGDKPNQNTGDKPNENTGDKPDKPDNTVKEPEEGTVDKPVKPVKPN
ncbi:DUF6777 domain-containing protein, partial [Streptomyces sp. NPDC048258]|uniref:DUF6777 domain-containing protein n=1 Tax=Streptomyces sp. NPDC048258 TaxID=3365527 RepID=UPI00371D2541